MYKPKWVLSIGLIISTIFVSLIHLLPQSASAQKYRLNLQQSFTENSLQNSLIKQVHGQMAQQPPRERERGGSRAQPPRDPRRGGSRLLEQLRGENAVGVRGGNLCAIAPAPQLRGTTNTVWRDRPLFIWQGSAQRVALLESGSEELLWSKNVTADDRSVAYDGAPLQPGQLYEWRLYSSSKDFAPRPFRIMPSAERNTIASELTALENQLKTEGASPEEIALERANYFSDRRLWSDALQEVYAVQNPSEDLKKTAQELATFICTPPQKNPQ